MPVERGEGPQGTSGGQAGMSECGHVTEWPCFGHFGQFGRFGQLGMTANCPQASSGCVLDRGGGWWAGGEESRSRRVGEDSHSPPMSADEHRWHGRRACASFVGDMPTLLVVAGRGVGCISEGQGHPFGFAGPPWRPRLAA